MLFISRRSYKDIFVFQKPVEVFYTQKTLYKQQKGKSEFISGKFFWQKLRERGNRNGNGKKISVLPISLFAFISFQKCNINDRKGSGEKENR